MPKSKVLGIMDSPNWRDALKEMHEKWNDAIDFINNSLHRDVTITFQRTFPSVGKVRQFSGQVTRAFCNSPSPSFVIEGKGEELEIFIDELHAAAPL